LSFAVFRQAPWHHYGLLALEQTQVSLRSPYLDNDLVRTVFRAPDSAIVKGDVFEDKDDDRVRLIGEGNATLRRIRTDRALLGHSGRLSNAASRGCLEFTFKAEYAYDYGMPQWLARIDHAFSRFHLERFFLGKHKFIHFRIWYRDFLAEYVREMLLDSRSLSRPYLERKGIEAMVQGHLKGNRNYTTAIHKVLTLELVHRLFVDSR
jgi:asparagine synthase (glutamine-hydrolysing)